MHFIAGSFQLCHSRMDGDEEKKLQNTKIIGTFLCFRMFATLEKASQFIKTLEGSPNPKKMREFPLIFCVIFFERWGVCFFVDPQICISKKSGPTKFESENMWTHKLNSVIGFFCGITTSEAGKLWTHKSEV